MASPVQTASNSINAGTSITVTLGSSTTAGNCLVVYVGAQQSTTNPTVSGITLGGAAGNFAVAKAQNNNADVDCEIWVDWNCAGGQTAVAISFNAGSGANLGMSARVEEWAGVITSGSPVDKTNGQDNSVSGGSFSSLSSGTLTQASELVVGAVCESNGSNSTITGPSSPWTNQTQVNAGTISGLLTGYQTVTATTAQTYSGTFSTNTLYSAVIVTLKMTAAISGAGYVVKPPGLQSPMVLAEPARFSIPPPPLEQPAGASQPVPPGFQSPMSLAQPPHPATQQAPAVPPASPWPTLPPTPPGLQSPSVLAEPPRFSIPPAPQQQPAGATAPIPPGLQSPMSLTVPARPATQPPPAPPPAPIPGFYQLTPPGRASPMSIGLGLYAPSPGPGPAPKPPAIVAVLPARAADYDGKSWWKKRWILRL